MSVCGVCSWGFVLGMGFFPPVNFTRGASLLFSGTTLETLLRQVAGRVSQNFLRGLHLVFLGR